MDLAHVRGHRLYGNNGIWFFESTGEIYDPENEPNCIACGLACDDKSPDPCIGFLPGVLACCCGHGDPTEEYVLCADGTRFDSIEEWRNNAIYQ